MGLVCVHPHCPLFQGANVIARWKMNSLEIIQAVSESGGYFLAKRAKCREHETMSGDPTTCSAGFCSSQGLCDPGEY